MTDEMKQTLDEKNNRRSYSEKEEDVYEPRHIRIRLFPIWLRLVLVLVLFFLAAVVGLTVGYSVIGEGEALDTFKWSTWQHMLDLMNGVE